MHVEIQSDAQFVLVVEKEAVAQHLLENRFLERHWPAILVTVCCSLLAHCASARMTLRT